jgi:DNA-binding NtrC family response regulator
MEAGSQVTIASGAAWGLSSAGELIAMSTSKEAEEDLKTILLVDDNPGVREVAAELLRGAGYRVIEAESAESALAAAANGGSIDLMIADIVMKGMRGTALGAAISETRPSMEILYVSGYPDEYAAEVEQQERARFLQKPFTAPALLLAIGRLLNQAGSGAIPA